MRRGGQRVRRYHHHIVEAHRIPVHLAGGGQRKRDLAPQNGDGHAVADLQAEDIGRFLVQRDQRRPAIVLRPPAARCQFAALRQTIRIGHAALAAQEPCAFRQLLQIGDANIFIGHDGAAKGWHHIGIGAGRIAIDDLPEPRLLLHRHVEHEIIRGALRHHRRDFIVQARLDSRQRDEQGQREAEGDDQRGGLRSGAVKIGERQAQQGIARARRPGGGAGDGPANRQQDQQHRQACRQHGGGEQRVARGGDGERGNRHHGQTHRPAHGLPPAAPALHHAAKDRRGRLRACAGQRRQGKHQRDQRTEGGGLDQRQRKQPRLGPHRQQIADQGGEQRHQRRTGDQPQQDCGQRDQADLQPVNARNVLRSGTEHLERGDAGPLGRQIGRHAIAHADAGDDERGQTDQLQKLAHPLEKPEGPRRGAVAGAELQPGARELLLPAFDQSIRGGAAAGAHAIFAFIHAARLDQLGPPKSRERGDGHRPQREALPHPVRLVPDDAAHGVIRRAVAKLRPCLQRQPFGQSLIDQDLIGGERRHRRAIGQRQPAIERIGAIDALELRQHRFPARHGPRHGAKADSLADGAGLRKGGTLGRIGAALAHRYLDIAAQQGAALIAQRPGDRRGQAADRGQGRHAQEQAQEKKAQPAQAGAQIAARQTPGGAPGKRIDRGAHDAAALSDTIRPSCISSTRSQRSASVSSWVMMISVAPALARRSNSRSTMPPPVARSRLPVGSSAKMIDGRGATARAMATRCCSPPESCEG